MTLAVGCGLAFVALCAAAWRYALAGDALESWSRRSLLASCAALLALSLAVRIALAVATPGLPTDIACFKAWAMAAAEGGLSRFYGGSMFVDYPPGYVYVLKAVGHARLLLGLAHDSRGFLLVLKLPAILLDLGAAGLVLWLARGRTSLARSCVLAVLVAWNPAAIHNSAVYGQIDVFLAVPVVLALALVWRGRWVVAAVAYTVAVLVKPQALLLAPLAVLALVRTRSARTAALAALAATATLAALVLPFSRDPGWLVGLYAKTLGSYPYATLNAANLYALAGANWAPVGERLLFVSHGAFGAVSLGAIVVLSAWLYRRSRDASSIFVVALAVLSAVFFLSTKMHERYLYPAALVAAAAYAVTGDRRLLWLFAGFCASVFLNEALLLEHVARTGSFFVPAADPALRVVAALNAVLVAAAAKVAFDVCVRRRAAAGTGAASGSPRAPRAAAPTPLMAQGSSRLARVDYLLMGGLTLAYAAAAFTNLGSLRAPQTCWRPSRAGESAYLDLGATRALERVVYFMGLGEGAYSLELSPDGRTWTSPARLEQATRFEKLEWRALAQPPGTAARYLRVRADAPGAMLCEIAAFDGPGRSALALRSAAPPGARGDDAGAELLVDEPGTATYQPSFFSGMYFDEIFHARTAYEHLHRLEPSENTHPPLGKAIIALGVAAFGMTPFGWRFMGTLFGVAMIPMLYLFAHRLFRRTHLAFLAAFLLAFDFMHFVQTRIATIDTYGVFFVMLMYLFMHRYLTRDFWRARTRDLLVPLLLSGIAFGLGAASKWSVLYGGAGLAVILGASLVARAREYVAARRSLVASGEADAGAARIASTFPRRAAAVIAWSCFAFAVVPALLYLVAYIPFLLVPGPGHGIADVVAAQAHMYRYHSGIAQTHPFSSAWWQWPIMQRPAWYYMGDGLPAGTISSIVAMGNPAVWWPGIAAVVVGAWLALRRRDAGIAFVLVGLFAQLAPWAVAPRKLVFIYHFFPCVPFLILALVYGAKVLMELRRWFSRLVAAYCAVVLALFALFYPILSAMPVRREFVLHWLRWFDSWIFC